MVTVIRFVCAVCGHESADTDRYLVINRIMVAEMPAPSSGPATGRIVIDDAGEPVTVCGQKCYHEWHAEQLAEFFDPSKKAREDVAAMVETFEAGYGQVKIDGALAVEAVG